MTETDQPSPEAEGFRAQALGPEEDSLVLAFIDCMESGRRLGHLQGWRITRDARFCWLELMSAEGIHFVGRGATFNEAKEELAHKLIAARMEGAPLA